MGKEMDIRKIKYTYQKYMTTNPPISINKQVEISEIYTGNFENCREETDNDGGFIKKYRISKEDFDEIVALFHELKIPSAILDRMNMEPEPDTNLMMGGYEKRFLSYEANGITVSGYYTPEGTNVFLEKIVEIEAKCGKPTYETNTSDKNLDMFEALMGIEETHRLKVAQEINENAAKTKDESTS